MISSISQLIERMQHHGVRRIYAKELAPNDNSKNQIYLGGDFTALNIIPHGEIKADTSVVAGSVRDRAKANVRFFWLHDEGIVRAPAAQLILYPKYPEVRMSGFLQGCVNAPSQVMRVRDEGRVLFIGVTANGDVLGYASAAQDGLSLEIAAETARENIGVFQVVSTGAAKRGGTRERLLRSLRRIYQKHWIASQKLGRDGVARSYAARNGGGYTLEAELGVSPNGYAGPDYLGWEIKQYGVRDFEGYLPKGPVTLLTPEPTGGTYKDCGVAAFLSRYGYADKNGIAGRINFGGIYSCGHGIHKTTGLRLKLKGYDALNGKITDLTGGIQLITKESEVAAEWAFTGIMKHWNRKHARAAYVPSLYRTPPPEYAFGSKILLCQKTDFLLFLKAVSKGSVYYDPAIKQEKTGFGKIKIKRRSQFRIKHAQLTQMYHQHESVDLREE